MTRQGLSQPLAVLLDRLAPILRGWASYFLPAALQSWSVSARRRHFRHGVSKATVDYLRRFTWRRVLLLWIRRKHRRANWRWIRRRYLPGWWPTDGDVALFDPAKVAVTRYRLRANIASPW